jgi:hypothetical protein
LFQAAADPARIVEVFLVESWVEHLRQHERVTEEDRIIQEHLLTMHEADTPPVVTHLVAACDQAAKGPQARRTDGFVPLAASEATCK